MIRIKELIYSRDLSIDEKYDQLLYLMNKLDGRFELDVNGKFNYVPNSLETSLSSGVITISSNHSYNGDVLISKIARNMADEEVGVAITRRLNYIPNELMKKVFYERNILKRDIRFIKKKYRLGSVSYYSLLDSVKNVLIEYMCLNMVNDTLRVLESAEQYEK